LDETGKRIADLIGERCESSAAFERELGIPEKTVNDWRRGKSKSYRSRLTDIAKILGTTSAYLLGEADDPSAISAQDAERAVKFALFGDIEIDDEVMAEVKDYAKFVAERKKKQKTE